MHTPMLDGIRKQAGWASGVGSVFKNNVTGGNTVGGLKSFFGGGGVSASDALSTVGNIAGKALSSPVGQRMAAFKSSALKGGMSFGMKSIGNLAGSGARKLTGYNNRAPSGRIPGGGGGMSGRYR